MSEDFMKEIEQIRALRLKQLIETEFRSQKEFCVATKMTKSWVSQLCNGASAIGEKTAREIESKVGYRFGWLDGRDYVLDGVDRDLEESLTDIIESIQRVQIKNQKIMDPRECSKICLFLLKAVQLAKVKGGVQKPVDEMVSELMRVLFEVN